MLWFFLQGSRAPGLPRRLAKTGDVLYLPSPVPHNHYEMSSLEHEDRSNAVNKLHDYHIINDLGLIHFRYSVRVGVAP